MDDLEIRPAGYDDLPALVGALGQAVFFADRLARQKNECGVLLTAWAEQQPVGVVYVWMDPAEEPEIRQHLPGIPLLNHIEVVDRYRGRGVGTALIDGAGKLLGSRGYPRMALAVEEHNIAAARLYKRLGFRDWGHHTVVCYRDAASADGTDQLAETCYVLVKAL